MQLLYMLNSVHFSCCPLNCMTTMLGNGNGNCVQELVLIVLETRVMALVEDSGLARCVVGYIVW